MSAVRVQFCDTNKICAILDTVHPNCSFFNLTSLHTRGARFHRAPLLCMIVVAYLHVLHLLLFWVQEIFRGPPLGNDSI